MEAFKSYLYGRSTADRKNDPKLQTSAKRHGTPTLVSRLHRDSQYAEARDPKEDVDTTMMRVDSVISSQSAKADMQEHNWRTVALWLYVQQQRKLRITGSPDEGVIVKTPSDDLLCYPANLESTASEYFEAIKALEGVRAAITMRNPIITAIFRDTKTDLVPLVDGLVVQIIPTMSLLTTCYPHAFAAFVVDVDGLVVWDDQAKNLIACCDSLEDALLQQVMHS